MKTTLVLLGLIFLGIIIVAGLRTGYEYENTIGSYWDLSDKASTLQQKSQYLDKYVDAIRGQRFASNDAIIFPTPNNSFSQNMIALQSLQGRMHQIANMDETSFAYQTAIQQITGQEQGEARELTDTIEGCWYLENRPFLWSWLCGLILLLFVAAPIGSAIVINVLE